MGFSLLGLFDIEKSHENLASCTRNLQWNPRLKTGNRRRGKLREKGR